MTALALGQALVALYNRGAPFDAATLGTVYARDVRFTDPVHSVSGLDALAAYLNRQYAPLQSCHFHLTGQWASADMLFLQWEMSVCHPRLQGGRSVTVQGLSRLQCQAGDDGVLRIVFHRDYFDLGELLYENIPLLGSAIRWLKRRLQA